jgi:hypothetical protein
VYRLVATAVSLGIIPAFAGPVAAQPFAADDPFVASYCISCHGADNPKGGLNLDGLATAFDDPAAAAVWVRVYDKVVSGEMPPKKRPEVEERLKFTDHLRDKLHAASLKRQQIDGRVVVRRLNRIEYENTLRDLLGTHVHVVSGIVLGKLSVRTQKLVAVEVNHVVWHVGNPDFGFPDDFRCVLLERGEIEERRDVDTPGLAILKRRFQFRMTLR